MVTTELHPQFQSFLAQLTTTTDPTSFHEAVKHQGWCEAMNKELRALEDNGTWVITDLPQGKKAIDCKWLYKTKCNKDGTIERLKARLVILGCRQRFGTDYKETSAPVAKMTTVRALLAVAYMRGWYACQMDVSNAFLHGDLLEDVYMKLPMGYTGVGKAVVCSEGEHSHRYTKPTTVCKLQKSL